MRRHSVHSRFGTKVCMYTCLPLGVSRRPPTLPPLLSIMLFHAFEVRSRYIFSSLIDVRLPPLLQSFCSLRLTFLLLRLTSLRNFLFRWGGLRRLIRPFLRFHHSLLSYHGLQLPHISLLVFKRHVPVHVVDVTGDVEVCRTCTVTDAFDLCHLPSIV